MNKVIITALVISAAVVAIIIASNPRLVAKDDWWCAPENYFTGWEKEPNSVPYEELLSSQKQVVNEWWKDELRSIQARSDVTIGPSLATHVKGMRFVCAEKLSNECIQLGCDALPHVGTHFLGT